MKRARRTAGYTIIEVMMFLIVSMALFVTAVTVVSIQNRRTAFTDSVHNLDQKIRDVLNDVDTGYFPTDNGFRCTVNGSGIPQFSASNSELGTNQDCTFVGKAIQIAPQTGGSGDESKYFIYTIAGRRVISSGGSTQEVSGIEDSNPRVIPSAVGVVEQLNLSSNLEFYRVVYGSGAGVRTTDGLSILSGFTGSSTGGVVSGYSRVSLATIPEPADGGPNETPANFSGRVANLTGSNITGATDGITICMQEAGGGRRASIIIGGNSQQASTIVQFDNNIAGECT